MIIFIFIMLHDSGTIFRLLVDPLVFWLLCLKVTVEGVSPKKPKNFERMPKQSSVYTNHLDDFWTCSLTKHCLIIRPVS